MKRPKASLAIQDYFCSPVQLLRGSILDSRITSRASESVVCIPDAQAANLLAFSEALPFRLGASLDALALSPTSCWVGIRLPAHRTVLMASPHLLTKQIVGFPTM